LIDSNLTFPEHLSANSISLLSLLLTKDQESRLGVGPRDAEEIKEHAFFKDINWDKLFNREIRPPFVP
jgi:hypothetical protein